MPEVRFSAFQIRERNLDGENAIFDMPLSKPIDASPHTYLRLIASRVDWRRGYSHPHSVSA